jgi:beta-galactosidase
MSELTIDQQEFLLDGRPFRILAGAMHYFRVHPHYWRDRLQKLKALGLNTLETYVAWNLHEPQPGKFNFSAWLDLEAYIRLAGELGLYVIVRPGPYICSEWEFGGLPAWLLADPAMRLRCFYPPYLNAMDRYFDGLIPRLAKLQCTHGGPIIAMQIENEYGSYGNDQRYLKFIEDALTGRKIDVPLFTSDGPEDEMLQYGTLPHILKTVNFGSRADKAFEKLDEYQPSRPKMCAEFWNGWFDHWGEKHHTRPAREAAQALDEILSAGASVSLYMFHGGTNFGFMNGANASPGPKYQSTVTSYDDDAPLDEAGNPTDKYTAFREVITRITGQTVMPVPEAIPAKTFGKVKLEQFASLWDNLEALSIPDESAFPETMEALGQSYGFIHYQTRVSGPRDSVRLSISGLHDRAQVFQDGELSGILERENPKRTLNLSIPPQGSTLEFLVENMGRVNYGPELLDRKGITGGVFLGQQFLFGWTNRSLPLDDLSALRYNSGVPERLPSFFRGTFEVDAPSDTYLALPGWTKGVAWINGFNLGRYWKRGPQKTLYIPAPLLKNGRNELVVFELHGLKKNVVELRDQPDLD